MADVTKTIGTASRDYSTFASWESDLDNDTPYDAGDNAIGEAYDDSLFDEELTIDGGYTLGLNKITLQAASGEAHDGTAYTGVRNKKTSGSVRCFYVAAGQADGVPVEINDLVGDSNGNASSNSRHGVFESEVPRTSSIREPIFRRCIANVGATNVYNARLHGFRWGYNDEMATLNCIAHNIINDNKYDAVCFAGVNGSANKGDVRNCTGWKTQRGSLSAHEDIFAFPNNGASYNHRIQNCIGMDADSNGVDFNINANNTEDHNCSSDTSASGTGSLTSKSAANQFVAATQGSEDLHLKDGADVIDAGADLGTTDGVNIDIDGRDRDAEGDTWDIGADEFVAPPGGSTPFPIHRRTIQNSILVR